MNRSEFSQKGKFAVIIPVFNHGNTVGNVIKRALELELPVLVIDDGSTDSTAETIRSIAGIHCFHHSCNRGKGAAIKKGFVEASRIADWAITIDADGQHNPKDAWALIQAIPAGRRPLVVGAREGMSGKTVPWTSRFGRKFSNFWVAVSGGPVMTDTQSGFRVYPLPEAIHLNVIAQRYQFEVEVLVKARWRKMDVLEVPVGVDYAAGAERISHFRPFIDFIRNTNTFARLIVRRIFTRSSHLMK